MNKPDGSANGPQDYHYYAHLGASWLCEHTCKRDTPSRHRNIAGAPQHRNENVHNLHAQLLQLPAKEEALTIARAFMDELFAHDSALPPHLYAAIWHQLNLALTS